ncbi:hypothetical protein GGI16_001380, partial [Coemansia sp. S142-1]
MDKLVQYLLDVIQSSYQDLEYLVPCASGTMPAVDVLRIVVDAVRNIHDASAVLDIGFRPRTWVAAVRL